MSNQENSDRAPVKCLECGKIISARIESDGSIRPIGRNEVCDCEDPDVQILEEDTSLESRVEEEPRE